MLHLHWMRCPRVFPAAPSIGRVNTTWISLSFPPHPPPPSPPSASYLPPSHGVTAPGADVGWKNNSSPAVGDGGWGAGEGPTRGRGIQRELEGLVGVGRCCPPRESEGWGGMRPRSRWGHEWERRGGTDPAAPSGGAWRVRGHGDSVGGYGEGGIRGRGSTMGIRGHGDMGTRGIRGHGDKGAPRRYGDMGSMGTGGPGDWGTLGHGDKGTRGQEGKGTTLGYVGRGQWGHGDRGTPRRYGGRGAWGHEHGGRRFLLPWGRRGEWTVRLRAARGVAKCGVGVATHRGAGKGSG